MLDTVTVDTEVNIRSKFLGIGLFRDLRFFRARKPAKDIDMK
jgi:hypothetical protein